MIRRYFATKDNTITNAFEEDLATRGSGSNMGASDILEVFSIYGQASSASAELSRVLIQFNVNDIIADRNTSKLAASGSVVWYLKMYDAPHSSTVPRDFKIEVLDISREWQEGYGLDMEHYQDLTKGDIGSNWMSASNTEGWTKVGGDHHSSLPAVQTFETGLEDLTIDVSDFVERWVDSRRSNYGFLIKMSSSYEAQSSSSFGYYGTAGEEVTASLIHNATGSTKSYYTKRFFGRDTEFFFKRPVLEARWDDSKRDDRGNFYYSSSLAPASDNLNTIYLYNYVRGRLRDIPSIGSMTPATNSGKIYISLLSGSSDNTAPFESALRLSPDDKYVQTANPHVVTGGWVSTGIYSASFALTGTTSLTRVYDVWFSGSSQITASTHAALQFNTSSIDTTVLYTSDITENQNYVLSMPTLQDKYRQGETIKLRLYTRAKNWSPNIYSVAVDKSIPSLIIESASYQIKRSVDDEIVVPYGTGSYYHTGLSYDSSGNYFDFDTSVLEKGYQYEIYFSIYSEDSTTYVEQPYSFKFKVSE